MGKRNAATLPRSTKILIGLLAFSIIFVFFFVFFNNSEEIETQTITPTTTPSSSKLHPNFMKDGLIYYAEQNLTLTPESFKIRANKLHYLRQQYTNSLNDGSLEALSKRCAKYTQHVQLLDVECTALWLTRLRHSEIVGVERFWGFEDTHYGAITLNLEGGMRAMFKPCTSSSEDTSKEVIASYLDQLLGFGQTAPVITRKIPVSLIESFVTSKSFDAYNQTLACAHEDGYFVGPMIGWWEGLIPIRTVRKYKEEVPVLYEFRNELAKNLETTQMQSKFHAFYLLIHILRHGKDEFITKYGDLVSLDLDRSKFKSNSPITGPSVNYTWCFTCYLDENVYNIFQAVGPSQPTELRLGALMRDMLSHEDIFENLWSPRLSFSLDERVQMLLDCIDNCIEKWGRENVLLNVKRSMTTKELVEYFVTHSVYKNQNGQQGPSNLDFLEDI